MTAEREAMRTEVAAGLAAQLDDMIAATLVMRLSAAEKGKNGDAGLLVGSMVKGMIEIDYSPMALRGLLAEALRRLTENESP